MLKALHHRKDPQCQMRDAEVMTTAIAVALHFRGDFEVARQWMHALGYISRMLSKSRFNRRLHRIFDLFVALFRLLGETWKQWNADAVYVIDRSPSRCATTCALGAASVTVG